MISKLRRIIGFAKRELFPARRTSAEIEWERLRNFPRYTLTESLLFEKKIRIPDTASYLFIHDELFNKEIYKFRTVNPKPYIIDCGANIGLSLIYFKKLYPEAKVVAFEPDEKIFEALQFNLQSFAFPEVNLINKACWNEETTLQFYSEGADGGRTAVYADRNNVIEVQAVRLKDYLSRTVDMLKLDIEGAEYVVLKDCKDNLKLVENIFVEYHSFIGQEQYLPEILTILKEAGFRLHITAPGLTSPHPFIELHDYAGMDNQLNIFGFREKK